jgi:hypothetical protein
MGPVFKNICPKCNHFKFCKKPCRFAEIYLGYENLAVWTKKSTDEQGREIEIIYSRSRERQQSTLSQGFDKRGRPALSTKEQRAFSSENESPFANFKPRLKQTGIFIDRFFHKLPYADLAVKYEMTVENARGTYHNSANRMLTVLEAMDTGEVPTKQVEYWKQKVKERSGDLPKGQKWYLLNKLFGLRPSEIAEMEGLDKKSSSVRQLIIRVSDQLKAGEISLVETTPEEAEAAKARLDEVRKKRRERHARNNQIR